MIRQHLSRGTAAALVAALLASCSLLPQDRAPLPLSPDQPTVLYFYTDG